MDSVLERASRLGVWRRGGQRAPHKPLLLLLALGRWQRGQTTISFAECRQSLGALLREFGPSRASCHPEYPFWRLQRDGLWLIEAERPMALRQSSTNPTTSELLGSNAAGKLPTDVQLQLQDDPTLVTRLAEQLLWDHFPESIHTDILAAVGLLADPFTARSARDPSFRPRVLQAYEFRCALCDLDIRMGNVAVGLEAAHIRWHRAGGDDLECNGLALCCLHHKLFDLGAFTVHTDESVLVSDRVHGTGGFDSVLLRFRGATIRQPVHLDHRPRVENLAWHRREVFKERPR